MYVCVYGCVHVCVCVCVTISMLICLTIYACLSVCTYVGVCVYRFAYTCECVYAFQGSAVLPKIGLFVDNFGTFDLMYAYSFLHTDKYKHTEIFHKCTHMYKYTAVNTIMHSCSPGSRYLVITSGRNMLH